MEKRVQAIISGSGFCSRRKAEDLIAESRVKVNGKLVSLGDKCFETDEITIDGEQLPKSDKKKYFVLNKPKDYVCSNSDPHNPKTVFDILPKIKGLISVGRLDKDTTGLLIVTTDGDFAQKIIHPSQKIEKEYLALVSKPISDKDISDLEGGIVIEGKKLSPCKIRKISAVSYSVTITEGRKRQVRNMFQEVGSGVFQLKRIRIGNLDLKNLNLDLGKFKEFSRNELEKLIFYTPKVKR